MPVLLIRLNGAPEDEVRDLRDILTEHRIDFYETHAGRWGISVAGIWLRDDRQLKEAEHLVDAYQERRAEEARHRYDAERREGRHETVLHRLLGHPAQSFFYFVAILAVLYLTIVPFVTGWG